MRILFFLQTAFTIWMLVDAIRRRTAFYWYLIIFFPLGEWVYFFVVKIHDFNISWDKLFTRPPSLDKLRHELRTSPSLLNRLNLADALHDLDQHREAEVLYAEVLNQDEDSKAALHGLGSCKLQQKQFDAAARDLERLVARDRAFRDYMPWQNLAEALWRDGKRDEAIAELQKLVAASPRLEHQNVLARYLAEHGDRDAARRLLQKALDDFRYAPRFQKRTSGRAAAEARRQLKNL